MTALSEWPRVFASWWLRATSWIVPRHQRAEWLEGWETEVRGRWRELGGSRRRSLLFQADLVGRALGAAGHALFLRLREWTPEILLQDLRFALRALRKRATFTLVAALTLTIGIGANTAVFSVVDSVLRRPLPFPEPDRLMMIWQTLPETGGDRANVSLPNLVDWRARSKTFDAIAASTTGRGFVTIMGPEEPRRVPAASVTDNFFDVLGVRPILGRGFLPGENEPDAPRVAVLSHRVWVRDFGASEDVLGRTLQISGDTHVIVGVAPPSLAYPDPATELWRPLRPENGLIVSGPVGRDAYVVRAVGRLSNGATVTTAQAEMDAISAALEQEYPALNQEVGARVVPLHDEIVRGAGSMLYLLLGAVALLLLIACANVANLQLFRAVGRRHEMTIRTAVGAGKLRIWRQLLTESLVLGLAGGVGGFVLAAVGLRSLVRFLPPDMPRIQNIGMDSGVLGYTAAVSLLATVLFGLAPALRVTRDDLTGGMTTATRVSTGRRRLGLGSSMVVAQIALALVLGSGAGLLGKSLWNLDAVDPGLESEGVVTMRVRTTSPSLRGPARTAFFDEVLRRVRGLSDVRSAGLIQHAPFGGGNWVSETALEGDGADDRRPDVDVRVASPDYFASVGIPLLRGRGFEGRDGPSATPVALVSESMADAFWPARSPLGERVYLGMIGEWATVIGVVGDFRHGGLDEEPRPTLYRPYAQWTLSYATLMVRVSSDAGAALPRVRGVVRAMDPTLVISREQTLDSMIRATTLAPRSRTLLLGSLAAVALLLAAVGVYGVMTYSVQTQTRELGIRLAIGAAPGSVRRLVVGKAAALCGLGVVGGIAVALVANRLLRPLLFEVEPLEVDVLAASAAFLLLIGVASAYIPAVRASRVDPIAVLRQE